MDQQQQFEQLFNEAGLLGDAAQSGATTLTCQQADELAARLKAPLRVVECFALDRGIVPLRYALNLGCFGTAGQKKLLQSRVLVVGLGGLGGHVVEQLARAGVGRIAAADPDVFQEPNLNRQAFCTRTSLGRAKVREVAEQLRQINAAVEFTPYQTKFQQLPAEAFTDLNLAFDCLDNVADRLALESLCSAKNLVLIHGAIGGWFGEAGVVQPDAGLLRRVYGAQDHGVETSLGNPPFTPAVVGSLLAALGIRALLGKPLPPKHSLQFIDLLEDEWEILRFS